MYTDCLCHLSYSIEFLIEQENIIMLNAKLATRLFATDVKVVNFNQLKGLIKDLKGDAGYDAKAKDFFQLLFGKGTPCAFEKLLVEVVDASPVKSLSITKLGNNYLLSMAKESNTEFQSRSCSTLINMVERFTPTDADVEVETLKGKALVKLQDAISKAEKAKGKNANVRDVLSHFAPECRLGIGRYKVGLPKHKITFNGFLGQMIVEVVDHNEFRRSVFKVTELKEALGL